MRPAHRAPDFDPKPPTQDHQPFYADELPLTSASEAGVAIKAAAARQVLARMGALDLMDMLGIGGAA